MWKIELTEVSTQLNCPSTSDGWEGDSCSSDYNDKQEWDDDHNVAYYVVDNMSGNIFWNPQNLGDVQDTGSCLAMRSTLIQLQSALRGDPPESEVMSNGDGPRRRVSQQSSFSEGTMQKSNRFEHVYRPTQMFQIPGMVTSGVSTISLIRSIMRGPAGHRSHIAHGAYTRDLRRIDTDAAACPVTQEYLNSALRARYECDEQLLGAMKRIMSREYQTKTVGTGDDHRLVSLCLLNEDREQRKHQVFDWLMQQEGTTTTTTGIEILRRIGTEKSQSVIADIIVDNVIERPWLSNVALFQATELERVSEQLLSVIESLTGTFTIYNNAAVTGNAWLTLASLEHARLTNKNVIPRSTKILQDPAALQSLSTPLLIDVLNNAGSALPVSELKRLVYDASLSMELRVRAAASIRRMLPADNDVNEFVLQVITDSQLPVSVRMGALKGQQSRDKTAEFLHSVARDPMQPRAIRAQAERMLFPQPQSTFNANCDPYALSNLDITPRYLQHNISTGRCQAGLGNDVFGASGSIFAFAGLSYNGCKDAESRSFKYALLGEANLEAHAFSEKFVLVDFDLKETGESISREYEDHLRLIIANQVWYDSALFPEHCYSIDKEVFRSGLKRLFGTTVHFIVLGVPVTIQIELQAGLVVRVEGEVCPVQMFARAGADPMVTLDISGSAGAGIKDINAGITIGGDITMGLLPEINATTAECPHIALCSKLESVVESPMVRVLGHIRFLKKKWSKTLYSYSKFNRETRLLFDKCVRL